MMKIPSKTDIPFRKRTRSISADQPVRPDLSGNVLLQGLRRLPMLSGVRVSFEHVLLTASLNRQTGPFRSSRKDPSPFPLQQQEDYTGFFTKKKFLSRTGRSRVRQPGAGACRFRRASGARASAAVAQRALTQGRQADGLTFQLFAKLGQAADEPGRQLVAVALGKAREVRDADALVRQ